MKENLNLTESERNLIDRLFDRQIEFEAGAEDAGRGSNVEDLRKIKRFDFRNKFLLSQPSHNFGQMSETERADLSSVENKLYRAAVRYERKALAFINRVIKGNAGAVGILSELPDGILGDAKYCSLSEALKPLAEDMRGDIEPETNIPSVEFNRNAGVVYMNDLPVIQLTLSRDVRNFVILFDAGDYPHLVKDCRANRWILEDYYNQAMNSRDGGQYQTGDQTR